MPVMSRMAMMVAVLSALPLLGCATRPTGDPAAQAAFDQTNDPLEPMNRFFFKVNNAIDAVVLRPAAIAYVNVVPAAGRTGVHNLLENLDTPELLVNDMLQGSPRRSGDTLMRFLINTTVGVGGVFDVAQRWGYPFNDTDFGVTLGVWGVGPGPFLYLPILGPSDPRDALGYGVDAGTDPLNYIGRGTVVTALRYTRYGIYAIDRRSDVLGQISGIEKTALDPYATLRSLYRQNRASVINQVRTDDRATPPDWSGAQARNQQGVPGSATP